MYCYQCYIANMYIRYMLYSIVSTFGGPSIDLGLASSHVSNLFTPNMPSVTPLTHWVPGTYRGMGNLVLNMWHYLCNIPTTGWDPGSYGVWHTQGGPPTPPIGVWGRGMDRAYPPLYHTIFSSYLSGVSIIKNFWHDFYCR